MRQRQRALPSARPAPGETDRRAARPPGSESRVEPARRRAGIAKVALGTGGALVFGAAMAFARLSYAGHPKRPPQPLAAPKRFVSIVRQNLLEAGIVAPAEAPPDAATTVS
jgi:hypothetical protein